MSEKQSIAFDRGRLIELAGRLCDQEISEDDLSDLERMLKSSKEARQLYHVTVALQRDLVSCEIPNSIVHKHETKSHAATVRMLLAIAASLLVAVTTYVAYRNPGSNAVAENSMLATVVDLVDTRWGEGDSVLKIGDHIGQQRLQVVSGTVCIRYAHGVVVTIDGPADIEFVSKDVARLHRGQIAAYVPEGAEGYQVLTESAAITDLGTEFGVTVADDGSSQLVVFDGEVEFSATNGESEPPQRVSAGLAYRIDASGVATRQGYRQEKFEEARTLLRSKRVVRESFRVPQSFPGTSRGAWTTGWSVDARSFVVDKSATGVQSDQQLFVGMKNYLHVRGEAESDSSVSRVKLSRSFASIEQFDATAPYTIEFAIRLDCSPDNIRNVRILSLDSNDDSATEIWLVRTGRTKTAPKGLNWRVYHPDEGDSHFSMMPVIANQAYRFLIEVDPTIDRWRASVSNGKDTIWNTLRSGDPLRFREGHIINGGTLQWEIVGVAGAKVAFSLDAIRIQNRPAN